jgi:serine/threonine protein kinase
MSDMAHVNNIEPPTFLEDQNVQIFRCHCGEEFNVTGYPIGYKFACPTCHAFCNITAQEEELRRGMLLGDFIVENRIARGGMGIVYKGKQISLDRWVAIKVLKPSLANNENFIQRFSSEARTAAQIIHNNVVQTYYVGRDNNIFFIAMEYVDGKTVRKLIRENDGVPEAQAIDILLQASEGLKKAHERNILHRDIKPDNLMVNKQGDVKVTDFGLAVDLLESKKEERLKKLEGSPHYMSPEQAVRGEVSFSSDIYSLGATLYYMVTSVPPFTGNTPAAIIAKHVTDYPRSPREINPELSKGLCNLLQTMMAKRPEERFSNMEEVITQFRLLKNDHTQTADVEGTHWFMEERDDTSRLNDMMAIVEINRVISQERNLDSLLLRIVHEITATMNAERSTLYIYDADRQEIWAKVAEQMESGRIIRLPVGRGIAGTVAQSLKTEVINDAYSDPRFNRELDAQSGYTTRNMICMPIFGGELDLLGVIQVLNKKKGDFSHRDESLLSALASNVGLTLENSRYFCIHRPECKEVYNY